MIDKKNLRDTAMNIWFIDLRRGKVKPDEDQKSTLLTAYHQSCLPADRDYSVSQWVEDGFPEVY